MTFKFPEQMLRLHTAVLGMTGSGKSSTARLLIEQVVAEGARVCILDPIKSDWWGITSSADGKRSGLPFTILGGPHGHVPLNSSAGKPIAELVGRGDLKLSILDMADFEAGGLQRFFLDFADQLMRSLKGVLYLVLEEAHEFAPKERAGFDKENKAIHYAKKLATGGRTKGVRLIVATQRTQSLHNSLLSSCQNMIAHRFTYPDDIKPVANWVKANTKNKAWASTMVDRLPDLADGEGLLISRAMGLADLLQFPRIKTFDNSKTPDGTTLESFKTAPVNLDVLRGLMTTALEEVKSNDPKALKEQIAKLQAELQRAKATPPAAQEPSGEAIGAAVAQGLETGWKMGYALAAKNVRAEMTRQAIGGMDVIRGALLDSLDTCTADLEQARTIIDWVPPVPPSNEWPETEQPPISQPATGIKWVSKHSRPIDYKWPDGKDFIPPAPDPEVPDSNGLATSEPDGHWTDADIERAGFNSVRKGRLAAKILNYGYDSKPPVHNAGSPAASVKAEGGAISYVEDPSAPENAVQQRILDAMADLTVVGISQQPRDLIAVMAGYSNIGSKGFRNAIGAMKSRGLIHQGDAGMFIEPSAWKYAKPRPKPADDAEHQARIYELLGGAARRILEPMIEGGSAPWDRAMVAAQAGYTNLGSKGFRNMLGRLNKLGFIEYPSSGKVQVTEAMFLP